MLKLNTKFLVLIYVIFTMGGNCFSQNGNNVEDSEVFIQKSFQKALKGDINSITYLFKRSIGSPNEILSEYLVTVMITNYELFKKIIEDKEFATFEKEQIYRVLEDGISDYPKYKSKKKLISFYNFAKTNFPNDKHIKRLFNTETLGFTHSNSNLSKEYDSSNAFDGDLLTTWATETNNHNKQNYLLIQNQYLHNSRNVFNKLIIYNGYTKNKETFYNHNRVKKAFIEFSNGDGNVVDFEDSMEPKEIIFNEIVISWVKITILEFYKGTKYNNTCISEVKFEYDQDLATTQYELKKKEKI